VIKKRLYKKGEEDSTTSASFLIKILLTIIVGVGLYFTIRGIANAFLPK